MKRFSGRCAIITHNDGSNQGSDLCCYTRSITRQAFAKKGGQDGAECVPDFLATVTYTDCCYHIYQDVGVSITALLDPKYQQLDNQMEGQAAISIVVRSIQALTEDCIEVPHVDLNQIYLPTPANPSPTLAFPVFYRSGHTDKPTFGLHLLGLYRDDLGPYVVCLQYSLMLQIIGLSIWGDANYLHPLLALAVEPKRQLSKLTVTHIM